MRVGAFHGVACTCAMLDTALDDSHCSSESSELALQMDLWPVKQQQRDYVRICVQEEVRLRSQMGMEGSQCFGPLTRLQE